MLYKCIIANTSAIWQQAAHTTYQPSSPSCSTRATQKSLTLNERFLRKRKEKSQENGPLAEKWQDRKRTRQKEKKTAIGDRKGESNDSPEIADRRETSGLPGLLWGRGWGGGGRRKSDGLRNMTWIQMSESWDDVGCSQKDSQGQPGEGELC